MLLKEFMQENMPLSKGSVKIPITTIRDSYRKRYDTLIKTKKFTHDVYKVNPGGRVIVHVKVPSETVSNFYYDTLIELEPTQFAKSIEQCNARFFSNCPSFVYTYAYIFYHLNTDGEKPAKPDSKHRRFTGAIIPLLADKIPTSRLLMPGTESKLGDAVLDNAPDTRNPHGLIMLDKSLYFSVFYLLDQVPYSTIFSTRRYRTEAQILAAVSDFDGLMMRRKRAERQDKERARKKSARAAKPKTSPAASTGTGVKKVAAQKPLKPISATRTPKVSSVKSTSIRRVGGG